MVLERINHNISRLTWSDPSSSLSPVNQSLTKLPIVLISVVVYLSTDSIFTTIIKTFKIKYYPTAVMPWEGVAFPISILLAIFVYKIGVKLFVKKPDGQEKS